MLTQERIDPTQKARLRGVATVRIEVPTSLGQTTMRAVRVRPEGRQDSAAELEGELDEELEQLHPLYGAEEVRRWVLRRYPGLQVPA